MTSERTLPRDGEIRLSGLSESEYLAFVEIVRYYVSGAWSATSNHPDASLLLARNLLAVLGK